MTAVIVRYEDGREVDVTEEVKGVYDLLVGSMDYGSGFLSIEDVTLMVRLALAAGYEVPGDAAQQMEAYLRMTSHCPTCAAPVRRVTHRPPVLYRKADAAGHMIVTRQDPGPLVEGGWENEEVTDRHRVIRASLCGHRFMLHTVPGEPAGLVPIP